MSGAKPAPEGLCARRGDRPDAKKRKAASPAAVSMKSRWAVI